MYIAPVLHKKKKKPSELPTIKIMTVSEQLSDPLIKLILGGGKNISFGK